MLIGATTIDITPDWPICLGSGRPPGPFTTIHDRLEANLLCLQSADGPVLLVSLDLLYPGDRLRCGLLARLGERFPEARLFLCATHTHSAPMTCDGMPGLGEPDHTYVDWLADRVAAVVPGLTAETVAFASQRPCPLAINRRLRRFMIDHHGIGRRVAMGPNPDGPRDDVVRMIRFEESAGRPHAIVWSYACHPNAFPVPHAVSADYPGAVRNRLREAFGPIPVLFLQGFSGDIRPPFITKPDNLVHRLSHWLRGPRFRRPSLGEWQTWADHVAETAAAAAREPGHRMPPAEVNAYRLTIDGLFLPSTEAPPALVWHLVDGGAWQIMGINAEPVATYRELVQRRFPSKFLLSAGCIDQVSCYLRSDSMSAENGYEVEGFREPFGFTGRLHAYAQERVLECLAPDHAAIRTSGPRVAAPVHLSQQ